MKNKKISQFKLRFSKGILLEAGFLVVFLLIILFSHQTLAQTAVKIIYPTNGSIFVLGQDVNFLANISGGNWFYDSTNFSTGYFATINTTKLGLGAHTITYTTTTSGSSTITIIVRPPPNSEGWFWSENMGWVSENCNNLGTCGTVQYGVNIDTKTGSMSGYAWSEYYGWMSFDPSDLGGCPPVDGACNARFDSKTGQISGWAKILVTGDDGWVRLRGANYGVAVNLTTKTMSGWGWNDGGDGSIGWINFDRAKVAFVPSWVETAQAPIYSSTGVGSLLTPKPPLITTFNATYCLETSGGINNFTSETGCKRAPFGPYSFPKFSNNYTSVIGKIDVAGILTGTYGPTKEINSMSDILNPLNGKVYVRNGDLTIDGSSPIIFSNAVGTGNGRGLIVVRGNLIINQDLKYDTAPVLDVKSLASLGWLVLDDGGGTKGKIIINSAVGNLVGAFYAETSISTGTTGVAANDIPLIVKGLMITHQFNFERQVESLTKGAEQVLYDGRILVSTPPGLEDISRALPVWRQAVP